MVFVDEEPLPPTRRARILRVIAAILLVMGTLLVLGLIVLQRLGGDSEQLRAGAEDYLSRQTGTKAEIGRFTYMGFYPDLRLDIGDIAFHDPETQVEIGGIGSIRFSMRFWDMFFSRQRIGELAVSRMDIGSVIHAPRSLVVESLALSADDGAAGAEEEDGAISGPAVTASGLYGGAPFSIRVALERSVHSGGRATFGRAPDGAVSARLPGLSLDGRMEMMKGGGRILRLDAIGVPEKIFTGDIGIRTMGPRLMIQADLQNGDSRLKADIARENGRITGSLVWPVLEIQDLPQFRMLAAAAGGLLAAEKKDESAFRISPSFAATLDVEAEKILWRGHEVGHMSFPLLVENGVAAAETLQGRIGGGDLSGTASLDTMVVPAVFAGDLRLKSFDYGVFTRPAGGDARAAGKADARISLNSRLSAPGDLVKNMGGEIVLISGEGTFIGTMLDVWDAGLVNVMLPGLKTGVETDLNCMIGAFKMEKGVARPETLFLDTPDLTVFGEGKIDLAAHTIDLKLTPQAKKTTLMNMMTAVRVKGDLSRPDVAPDRFSLGTKIGKLVLGVINPASMALTMTDLGVAERHPCRVHAGPGQDDADRQGDTP